MLYGIILESVRESIIAIYGLNMWKRIVHEVDLPSESFDQFAHYNDTLMLSIADCLADILHEGTRDTCLEFFGQDLFRHFKRIGFHKLFRIAGRTLRESLFAIDQLHDCNRFTFPDMRSPLFHVTEEDHMGATLEYKSPRQGLIHYAKGSLLGLAKTLYKENNAQVYIRSDLSTKEYTHIVFWIQFSNKRYQTPSLFTFPQLPNVAGSTFFSVFPFSILMDSSLRIHHMGRNVEKLFPTDTILTQRPLDEVFRLIRPYIHVEWDKLLSYGRHIVFVMENRLPLRNGPSGRIRLKGQMKYIENKNMLWFLCNPVLGSADDMISAGLHLTDLNLFDSASELLINSMHQTKEVEDVIQKQKACGTQLEQIRTKLLQYRKYHQNLLQAIVPKHIASMIQSGVPTYSFCEAYPLITVMFAYIVDLEMSTNHLEPAEVVQLLDEIARIFDETIDKYDAFRIKTKKNGSYMVVAGLYNRSNHASGELGSLRVDTIIPKLDRMPSNSFQSLTTSSDTEKDLQGLNATEIIAYLSFELLHASEILINPMTHKPFDIKIGFHTGAAIGGMVGDGNLQYCLFGDTVTTAKQIMLTGEPGRIHISQTAYQHLVADNRFTIEYRGHTNMKAGDTNTTYWLRGTNKLSSLPVFNQTTQLLRCSFSGKLL